jgi:glycosyltransferase involved in cell wall biosynthesis
MIFNKIHRPLTFFDFYQHFSRLVRGLDVDVIHAHDLNTLPGAYYVARRKSAKLVYDSHELYLERNRFEPYLKLGREARRIVEKFLVRRSDHIITVNESIAGILSKRYCVMKPSVITNTPILKKEILRVGQVNLLRKEIGIADTRRVLLYVGAISINRGIENVIRCIKLLPECHLVLMGYGDDAYKKQLMTIAHECGVADCFSFFGPVPSDQVTVYAAGADLGIAAIMNVCLSYYFCSPNKIFEYLQAGIPIIASDFPELRKIIHTYGIGATFNPEDPADIARAARQILDNPGEIDAMRRRLSKAALRHNWSIESKKLHKIYRDLGVCQ